MTGRGLSCDAALTTSPLGRRTPRLHVLGRGARRRDPRRGSRAALSGREAAFGRGDVLVEARNLSVADRERMDEAVARRRAVERAACAPATEHRAVAVDDLLDLEPEVSPSITEAGEEL